MVVTVPAGGEVELWGHLDAEVPGIEVRPRSSDWLPEGIEVEGELLDKDGTKKVRLLTKNRSSFSRDIKSCHVLAELHHSATISPDLEAVVGPGCEAQVHVDGVGCRGLVDSGSQVTVISETFFKDHLGHKELEQVDEFLDILGAGGQKVPYLGVVAVEIGLPAEVAGTRSVLDSYAIVCPDNRFSEQTPVIIGTNTLRKLSSPAKLPIRCEAAFALKEASTPSSGYLGSVRVPVKGITVGPHQVLVVNGRTRRKVSTNREEILVQEPTGTTLPTGLQVMNSKIHSFSLPRAKVTLVNRTGLPIHLEGGMEIADLFEIKNQYSLCSVIQQLQAREETDTKPTTQPATESQKADLITRLKFADDVEPGWKDGFTQKLLGFAHMFNLSEFQNIGRTEVQHDIELTPGPAMRDRPRPVPPQDMEELRQHLQQLLDANIIKPSTSPFASPIVLVRKGNGKLRMCCDYRKINSRTVRDSYALPKIEDLFMTLGKSKFFTSLDLSKAYYQVPLTERAKKISAFTTPFGLFEFERLSFGMVNAPMTFQRLMEQCFSDMNLVDLIIFLDDLLIHAETLEELEEKTIKVLQRLQSHNLTLDPDKCVFGAREVKHLGFMISGEGLRPDPKKVEALTSWPTPKTVREIKSFLGFAGYYRRHVARFSQLAKPLNDLTAGYIPRGTQKKGGKKGALTLSSDISHLWTDVHTSAFNSIIQALTSEPLLGIADKSKPFQLHCDASGTGLGAVLYQEQEGRQKVIAYASRGLSKTEANYPAHKREFLALKWAMSDKFHDYLIGAKVTVVTDNNPLCYILKNARLDATSHRWLASLSLYDFQLKYKRGSTHTDADGLSRRPQPPPEDDPEYLDLLQKTDFIRERAKQFDEVIQQEAVTAIITAYTQATSVTCNRHAAAVNRNITIPAAEVLNKDPTLIPDEVLDPIQEPKGMISLQKWKTLQAADPNLRFIIQVVKGEMKPPTKPPNPDLRALLRELPKLFIQDGVLYRKVMLEDGGMEHQQLVVPEGCRREAITGVHEDLYHIGAEGALQQARLRFFWPYMARDIEAVIKKCPRCVRKGALAAKAPLQTITTSYPLELLSIDFLTIESKGKKQDVLVILDHFTKFAQAVPTANQSARTVAKALWEKFFMVYGFPSRILSDQGRDFESKLIKEVCSVAGIKKCRTTPYHPAGNPVERWNRTLIGMLRSLDGVEKENWIRKLPSVVHAYNACIHSSTGYSPFYLFFGRHPRLPIDLAFGLDLGKQQGSPSKYIQQLKSSLKAAYENARKNMEKRARQNQAQYNPAAHAAELEVGDCVLVRRLGHRVAGKLADKWEEGVYRVTAKHPQVPVYTVIDEQGKSRTLHRNLLLPVGFLSNEECKPQAGRPVPRPRVQKPKREEVEEEDTSDEELLPSFKIILPGNRPGPPNMTQMLSNPAPSVQDEEGDFSVDSEEVEEEEAQSEDEGSRLDPEVEEGQSQSESESTDSGSPSRSPSPVRTPPIPLPRRSLRQSRPTRRLIMEMPLLVHCA